MWTIVRAALVAASAASALRHKHIGVPAPKLNINKEYHIHSATFDQLLNHSNPDSGTFSQRYWWSTEYWKGPGSPVVIFTPGEEDAAAYTGYCTNYTLNGLIAEEIGAATIVIEHRYWGKSSPYKTLTTEHLQYLTLENNIQDLVHFAQTVDLPFATNGSSTAQDVPWVLIGGSYSGALTAWTMNLAPGTFWAGLATSAPVEAISDYWTYFAPIQQGMPKNCSVDVGRVIDYMDGVMLNGDTALARFSDILLTDSGTDHEIQTLKKRFGALSNVEHNDDFMGALANGPFLWQELEFFEESGFFQFCNYIENVEHQHGKANLPGPDGVGLDKALDGYVKYMKDVIVPGYCESYGYFTGKENVDCFDSYNASNPLYSDVSLNNTYDRQWDWLLCNQPFGYWQDGPPSDQPTLISRLVTADYYARQCGLWFPPGPQGQTYGLALGRTEADVNAYTDGWFNDDTTRMIYTNGQFDPWREAGVSSDFRPGGPLQSTAQVPVNIIPDGVHCYDLLTANGEANAGCNAVQQKEIAQIAEWVKEWPGLEYMTMMQ